jgi:DNA-binding CsgD family transcriptional regulator
LIAAKEFQMTQPDIPRAVLIAMHDDILLSIQDDDDVAPLTPDQDAAAAPTQTISGSEYPIVADSCVIGRNPECDIRIRSYRTDISRRHATIKREGATFTLYDHSRYGTYINGERINGLCRLDTEDILGFANSREMLRFVKMTDSSPILPLLTDRERDTLRLVALGRLNKEIAAELTIAPNTVNTHLKSIYQKLGVHNRTEAVAQARKLRLL